MLVMAIYLRFSDTRRGVILKWRALRSPITTQSQMLILICHLVFAQALQLIGYLMSAIHLAKGRIISPSLTCETQGTIIFISHILTNFSIANIATHSAYCISRLKPMALNCFVLLNVVTWILTLSISLVFPHIHNARNDVPFFTFGSIACFVSNLWRMEKILAVYVPCLVLLGITIVLYPFISYRLVRHSGRLGRAGLRTHAVTRTEKEILRASKRVLMFPLATIIITLPFLTLSIMGFQNAKVLEENSWTIMLVGMCIAIAPLFACIFFFFMTSFFRSSSSVDTTEMSELAGSEAGGVDLPFPMDGDTVKTYISSPAVKDNSIYYSFETNFSEGRIKTVDVQPGFVLPGRSPM
ncbi:hypothetical protein BCR37DRAFT_261322 [Protomyces lactucae-debilis]|uniref:G-protein coupled receptors family 1 profile domain-containing protein n=1 Tax=Protomyces lactucae-debilis TaxID=2754530 RepID=A0A1Y2FJX0_PROLT|nr:uncharacterized protein BCR37DRAFT_261322 [Protomyces lactucae-debilis]ORY84248.1 hypothetical protein BCR37DRAFT_261322 [Protomyces lactucae-debilis]